MEMELEKKLGIALSGLDPSDAFNYAQAHLIVGVYLVLTTKVAAATQYIGQATSMIERTPHVFLPSLDRVSPTPTTLGPSEDVQQRFSLIASVVNYRSLFRIHLLEKENKAKPTDVLNGISVCIDPIYPRSSMYLPELAGPRCPRSFGFHARVTEWNIVISR